ncbi:hypothetical protein BRADI_1g06867v3, partial [Brachypodium distachyon]
SLVPNFSVLHPTRQIPRLILPHFFLLATHLRTPHSLLCCCHRTTPCAARCTLGAYAAPTRRQLVDPPLMAAKGSSSRRGKSWREAGGGAWGGACLHPRRRRHQRQQFNGGVRRSLHRCPGPKSLLLPLCGAREARILACLGCFGVVVQWGSGRSCWKTLKTWRMRGTEEQECSIAKKRKTLVDTYRDDGSRSERIRRCLLSTKHAYVWRSVPASEKPHRRCQAKKADSFSVAVELSVLAEQLAKVPSVVVNIIEK